ncbi:hypothetical protein ES705_32791 [subsurface metagenome]
MELSLAISVALLVGGLFLILDSISVLLDKQIYPYFRLALGIVIVLGAIYGIILVS